MVIKNKLNYFENCITYVSKMLKTLKYLVKISSVYDYWFFRYTKKLKSIFSKIGLAYNLLFSSSLFLLT